MKSICLVAVLAAFGIAMGASADNTPNLNPFSLRLELPSDSVNCGRAESLGDVFAAQTGLTVTSAVCQGTHTITEGASTYTTVTLVINYMAAAEASPTQAIYGGSEFLGAPSENSGLFAKYGDCLNARGAQEAAFSANTGLQVFASYCDVSTDDVTPGYSLVVEAFGTPKASLFAFTQDSELSDVPAEVMAAAKSAISAAGGTVVLSDATHIFYYAPYALDVEVSELGLFDEASQCQAQQLAAQTIFTQGKATGVTALCESDGAKGATLTVVSSGSTNITDDSGYNSDKYSSFSDCMNDLSRVLQNAQSSGQTVLGAICKPSDVNSSVFIDDIYTVF